VYAHRHPTTDDWSIGWTVENKKAQSLKISSVRLPHGQFKAQEREFELALNLTGGASAEFETLVHCKEPPGLVTENAFVIFYVSWLSASWRIFVRVRVQSMRNWPPKQRSNRLPRRESDSRRAPRDRLKKPLKGSDAIVAGKEEDLYILKRMRG
jgi:hypothetical protein